MRTDGVRTPESQVPDVLRSKSITTGPVRRVLLLLALPVLGEQLLNTLVGLVDVWLAGRIDVTATTAVGLGAYVSWLSSMIVMLVGTGTTALVARFVGAGDDDQANRFANQSITLAGLLGVCLFIAMYGFAPLFATYANLSGEAWHTTVDYLQFDAIGHGLTSITLVGCAAMRGAGDMKTPMLIFAVINGVNIVASAIFVYGFGPVPAMGVTGIVMGTVTARSLGGALTLLILGRGRAGLRLASHTMRLRWQQVRRILNIGVPAAIDGAVMWAGHLGLIYIIGRLDAPPMGEVYLAAHIIAVRVESLTYLPAVAWAAAVATMIGQALGARDPDRALRAGNEGVLQCGLLSLVITVVFFFGAEAIYRFMSNDPRVIAAGAPPFRWLALLQPCLVLGIVYIGGLRGAGDTRRPLLITLFGAWILRVPLAAICGLALQGGLYGAWAGMAADMMWRAVAAAIRFRRGRWLRTTV